MKTVKDWLDGISKTEPVALSPILRAVQIDAVQELAARLVLAGADPKVVLVAYDLAAEIERSEDSYAAGVGVA